MILTVMKMNKNFIFILFAVAFLSCQEGGRSVEAPCEKGDIMLCDGETVGNCEPGYRVCFENVLDNPVTTYWSECIDRKDPEEERCNYGDDDCDGEIDEGVANLCGKCGLEPQELCNKNDDDCDGEIDEGFAGQRELCNGIDEDCDGVIDEGLSKRQACEPPNVQAGIIYNDDPGSRSSCLRGWTECREGSWTPCAEWQGPTPEICDGIDNNCNGDTDEIDALRRPCGFSNIGQCEFGIEICFDNDIICVDSVGPQNEICDGIDNDCDWYIDEELARECSTICGEGVERCQEGTWIDCTAPQPVAEVCNGVDDDCDGLVDEDIFCECQAGAMQPCIAEPCGWGTQVCLEEGVWDVCVGGVVQAELCNNHDDNCNQQVDENLSRPCYEGPENTQGVGVCVGGIAECREGEWQDCVGQVVPNQELCDGIDNDCDGNIDNLERFFEKVDMVFVVDVSGSMNSFIDSIATGITRYVSSIRGQNHKFGLILYGSNFYTDYGESILFLQLSEISDLLLALANIILSGQDEPSIDAIFFASNPSNELQLAWRSDATPIIILLSDEEPQTRLFLTQQDLQDLTRTCLLPGCNSQTNDNWTDGDPLELFAFVHSSSIIFWEGAIFAEGNRVFNIQRLLFDDMLEADLELIFREVCRETE